MPVIAEWTIRRRAPVARRAAAISAMLRQLATEDTLVPPNLRTILLEGAELIGRRVAAGDKAVGASGKKGRRSSRVMRSSSRALPLTAAVTPKRARAARSFASRTPPEACQESSGK